jgi:uncharacterized protein (UPF0297 family)
MKIIIESTSKVTIEVHEDSTVSDCLEAFTIALKAAGYNYIEQVGALGDQGDLHVPTHADSMRWYSAFAPKEEGEII